MTEARQPAATLSFSDGFYFFGFYFFDWKEWKYGARGAV